jgi:diguanylate cyclase (GGDEF)-like protein
MDFSARGLGRVWLVTIGGTLICMLSALFVDSFNFPALSAPGLFRALLVDTLLPLGLAMPMLGFLTTKLRELAIAKHELTILASTDSLTAVLNRGAFTMVVDGYLAKVRAAHFSGDGALLIVDVDHFKQINDRFGHAAGDAALQLIASAIQGAVRAVDLVGRIGGEEFGVFLPGSTPDDAGLIAMRIRDAVAASEFRPMDATNAPELSVSVGGAIFTDPFRYDELFHVADHHLYLAKSRGRNRVELKQMAA